MAREVIKLLSLLLVAFPAGATLIPATKLTLGSAERLALTRQVCGEGMAAERIEAKSVATNPASLHAKVICASRGNLAGHPALRVGECEKPAGEWECKRTWPALKIRVRSGDLLVMYTEAVTADEAVEIIEFASGVTTFNGLDVSGLVVGQCRVTDGVTKPFPGARSFTVSCEAPSMDVTKDCWDGGCRLFITHVDYAVP